MIILCGEGFYPLEGYNIFDLEKKNGGTYSSMQAGKYGLSKVKIGGIFFNKSLAAILNSEKAKRRGTSHTTEIESSDTDLSFYAKKFKVYATARFSPLLPDYNLKIILSTDETIQTHF